MRSTDLTKLKSLKKQIKEISNMTVSDFKSIDEGLKPIDKLTHYIVFLLYNKYVCSAINEYIETFNKPVQETLITKLSKWFKGVITWLILFRMYTGQFPRSVRVILRPILIPAWALIERPNWNPATWNSVVPRACFAAVSVPWRMPSFRW